jgi:carboxyl-terminal processing protease
VKRRFPLIALSLVPIVFVVAGAVIARVGVDRDAYRFLSVFGDALQLMRSHYVEQVDEEHLLSGAFEGMVSGLDGFSAYLTAAERAELERPLPAGSAGVSVLPGGGGVVAVQVWPDSPASEAGLKPGDQIWAIDGEPTRGQALAQVLRRLSGDPGETRGLSVLDGGSFTRREVEIVLSRQSHGGASVTLEPGAVALLTVQDLTRVDAGDLRTDLEYAIREGSALLLIDLRDAVGGTPDDAARFLSLFLDGGPAVTITDRTGGEATKPVPGGDVVWSLPIHVLVNRATAGGAEIVAAALRDRSSAPISGERTYGQGSLQELLRFEDGSGVLLSTRALKSPAGETWNTTGLDPDEPIEQTAEARRGEAPDNQLDQALEWSREAVREAAA